MLFCIALTTCIGGRFKARLVKEFFGPSAYE